MTEELIWWNDIKGTWGWSIARNVILILRHFVFFTHPTTFKSFHHIYPTITCNAYFWDLSENQSPCWSMQRSFLWPTIVRIPRDHAEFLPRHNSLCFSMRFPWALLVLSLHFQGTIFNHSIDTYSLIQVIALPGYFTLAILFLTAIWHEMEPGRITKLKHWFVIPTKNLLQKPKGCPLI